MWIEVHFKNVSRDNKIDNVHFCAANLRVLLMKMRTVVICVNWTEQQIIICYQIMWLLFDYLFFHEQFFATFFLRSATKWHFLLKRVLCIFCNFITAVFSFPSTRCPNDRITCSRLIKLYLYTIQISITIKKTSVILLLLI